MSYLVFARKFRPQTFDEIVGQEPVAKTLKNAIAKDRVAQSFLFTGSRGIGKTSTARILAKALNCEKGPTPEPCNKCVQCQEVTNGSSLDVLEIDGASNRGIEEIRNLRENVKFKPAGGRYKVYIIDEVHMLTGEAFNALLKTLEEPPAHVKFIFATTEVHKVPATILSRCQRFNFRRIPTEEIAKKLKEIIKLEKIKAKDNALFMVAKAAEGSLRDAESILDQLASFSEGEIKVEDVVFSLGLTPDDIYFPLLEQIRDRQAKEVLEAVQNVIDAGHDLTQFAKGLLEVVRNLMLYEVGGGAEKLVEATKEQHEQFSKMRTAFSREELLFVITLLQQLVRDIRWTAVPRFLIEAALLKMVHRAELTSVAAALQNLKTDGSGSTSSSSGRPEIASKKKTNLTSELQIKPAPANASAGNGHSTRPHPVETLEPSGSEEIEDAFSQTPETFYAHQRHVRSHPASPAMETDQTVTLNDVERVWPDLLERVKSVKMSCGIYLSEAEPADVVEGLCVFGLTAEFKFHKESLETVDNKELVRSTLSQLLGAQVRISFVISESARSAGSPEPVLDPEEDETVSDEKVPAPAQPEAAVSSKPVTDIVTEALNIFEGSKVIYKEL